MTYIILEDESIASQRLERLITECDKEFQYINTFESIESLAEYLINHNHPDVIFMDIQVADGNSLELFKVVDIKSRIIFTTAYDNYAVDAFRKNAIDYLLKPIKKEELTESLTRVKSNNPSSSVVPEKLESITNETKERFLIKFGSKLTVVKTADIAYIFSENKISYFVQKNGQKVASDYTLQELETMLDKKYFFRVNRQFISHIDSITNMSTYSKARINLKLNPDFKDDIIVSTEKTPEFKEWLKEAR
jgi:two-component system, LytTR family, response regulator LytT